MKILGWITATKEVYFGNAAAVRDYRVQLRGSRSVLLFGVYLFVLIGIAFIIYSQAASNSQLDVIQAQYELKTFYNAVMLILATVVSVIAPALSATTVIAERQRHSLDLVFSAPVSPKYYLVGKMISSFRYTWMLLVLSLPVTAACVVLGGASWIDVLVSYLLLSIHGLVLTSLALLISSLAQKPVAAVIWSYCAAAGYLIPASVLAGSAYAMSRFGAGMMGGGGGNEFPFWIALSPFFVTQAAGTYTVIGAAEVPNWVFAAVISLLLCKVSLLGAGSALNPWAGAETRSLRLHGLIYFLALMFYIGWAALRSVSAHDVETIAGLTLCWMTMPLILILPIITCFGFEEQRRLIPNGAFRLKSIFDGTPAGALPYIALFIFGSAAAFWLGAKWGSGITFGPSYPIYAVYILGFWTLFWGVGRFASSFLVGLRAARTIQFSVFLVLCVLPLPFLSAVAWMDLSTDTLTVWDLYILRPIFGSGIAERVGHAGVLGIIMLLLGTALSAAGETNLKKKLNGPNFATA